MIKITGALIEKVAEEARLSKRKRMNYNFHKSSDESLQRLLNVAYTGTYIRPHKHESPDKTEAFIILKGRVLIAEFDEQGKLTDSFILDAKKGAMGVEIPARVYHAFICLEDASCLYELKEGPYIPNTDKNFAPWAPEEGTKEAERFNKKILQELKIA